jgi:hypothetical protein
MPKSAHCPHCDTAYALREDTPEWSEVTCTNCRQSFVLTFPPVPRSEPRPSPPTDFALSARWKRLLFGSWRVPVAAIAVVGVALALLLAVDAMRNGGRRKPVQQFPRVPLSPLERPVSNKFGSELSFPESGSELGEFDGDPFEGPLATLPPPPEFRIFVDTTFGGSGWGPETTGDVASAEDSNADSAIVRSMTSRGWSVNVFGPRFASSPARLADFGARMATADLLIRPTGNRRTRPHPRMVASYQQAVRNGAVLLLWGRHPTDALATAFGLRFNSMARGFSLDSVRVSELTTHFDKLEGDWVGITRMPIEAVELAWVHPPNHTAMTVLGCLPYGKGLVIFCGADQDLSAAMQEYLLSLAAAIDGRGVEQLKAPGGSIRQLQLPEESARPAPPVVPGSGAGRRGVMRRPDRIDGPELLSPADQTKLLDPAKHEWTFDWSDAESAREYRVVIVIPTQPRRVINRTISESQVTFAPGTIKASDAPLTGWEWRARSVDQQGRPSNWSRTRTFDVETSDSKSGEQLESPTPAGTGSF